MASTTSSLLHILLLLLLLSHPSEQQQTSSLSPSDKAALFDIRSNLRDLPGSNFFSTWDFASDPCATFAGVICSPDDEQGTQSLRVSVLTLGTGLADSPGLTGILSPSLANLTALTDLVVYAGRIYGPIPPNIGTRLRRLRLVSISNNPICGPIPVSLAGLPDLHTLDLGHNKLQGPIPTPLLLPSSPNLKVLILAANGGLSGELPPGISTAQLLHLDLRGNYLTGALPRLPSTLRYLSASDNALSGTLDNAFAAQLPDLAFLDLSMNAFTGPIPPALFALPRLSSILLQRNNLSGPLAVPPPGGEAPPSWAVVDLSHNVLTGEVPAALAAAGSLFLNNNRLTGAVPKEVARSVYVGSMTTLYAQHNYLTSFPAQPLPLPDSVALCLSYNCMSLTSAAAAGCPGSAGTQPSRPSYQCSNITIAVTGGRDG
ncbi:receptor-like protein kinase BRI1-like 3 [Elaeis guineensis]|uniref:LRR receptor-like serine/threonine-protein kinase ERL1 n=1 Tax=Elaeis guineensis var. tenera TaxID=51953 RepID=A0A6I9QW16_ELAGV|nr:LRR receptor-like serine/threonine-protein kinase ERL1 [Elaeis guineensis]